MSEGFAEFEPLVVAPSAATRMADARSTVNCPTDSGEVLSQLLTDMTRSVGAAPMSNYSIATEFRHTARQAGMSTVSMVRSMHGLHFYHHVTGVQPNYEDVRDAQGLIVCRAYGAETVTTELRPLEQHPQYAALMRLRNMSDYTLQNLLDEMRGSPEDNLSNHS
jgi:hypothetical protein